jgi:nucleotide-binding universal stress UspA family protein
VYGFYPVMAMPSTGVFMSEEWLDGWRTDLQRDLEGDWTKPLRDAGVPVVTRVEQGLASEVLLRLARENSVDLIVVGSRGFGAVREAILGSVSHILALHAPCPVVVLPHHHGTAHVALPVPQTATSDTRPHH